MEHNPNNNTSKHIEVPKAKDFKDFVNNYGPRELKIQAKIQIVLLYISVVFGLNLMLDVDPYIIGIFAMILSVAAAIWFQLTYNPLSLVPVVIVGVLCIVSEQIQWSICVFVDATVWLYYYFKAKKMYDHYVQTGEIDNSIK